MARHRQVGTAVEIAGRQEGVEGGVPPGRWGGEGNGKVVRGARLRKQCVGRSTAHVPSTNVQRSGSGVFAAEIKTSNRRIRQKSHREAGIAVTQRCSREGTAKALHWLQVGVKAQWRRRGNVMANGRRGVNGTMVAVGK